MYQETDSIVVFITVNGIIISTKQPSAERYLTCKHFFDSIVVNFGKILAVHQRNILKIFKKFTKETSVAKSYFSKVAGGGGQDIGGVL